jgi:hypothetical protein
VGAPVGGASEQAHQHQCRQLGYTYRQGQVDSSKLVGGPRSELVEPRSRCQASTKLISYPPDIVVGALSIRLR